MIPEASPNERTGSALKFDISEAMSKAAIHAYAGLCSVMICEETPNGCNVEIEAFEPARSEGNRVIREFLNYLLDLSLETHLGQKGSEEAKDAGTINGTNEV